MKLRGLPRKAVIAHLLWAAVTILYDYRYAFWGVLCTSKLRHVVVH